ncbi:hypothetical protein HanRHA438_Chr16g0759751 [Helianthus annuus]|uniref:Uncharacterized protein n=1 Tax=Helianthus annuus TaxID=4232 RepID=A0A9K3GY52_HELAN|nr:hypothetical protein HanXRQr2_Chr16g0748001 [Helianthus annuus]KAJ0442752.1 hypothetical protein HanIR_Chr16g0812931 [Helianthus annuus]KAJ0821189.1 hypothetical protein HanPSC8_Chr16g0717071 [Helianthus annuus]KAJ0835822.1 hypothetical protein HanRHA438_Chr16g0759751 [Helianthus annuus]
MPLVRYNGSGNASEAFGTGDVDRSTVDLLPVVSDLWLLNAVVEGGRGGLRWRSMWLVLMCAGVAGVPWFLTEGSC